MHVFISGIREDNEFAGAFITSRMITIGRNVGFRSIRDIVYSTFSRTNEFEIELVPRTFSVQRLNARNTAIRTCRPGNNVTGAVPLAPHIYICRCVALIVSK